MQTKVQKHGLVSGNDNVFSCLLYHHGKKKISFTKIFMTKLFLCKQKLRKVCFFNAHAGDHQNDNKSSVYTFIILSIDIL